MNLKTLLKMDLSPDFKSDLKTLILFSVLTPVSLLLLPAYLALGSLTLLTRWLWDITNSMVGRLRMQVLKTNQCIYTRTN